MTTQTNQTKTSSLPDDTPAEATVIMNGPGTGHLWHTMRRANGSWTGLGDVNGQFSIPGPVTAVSAAGDGEPGETQFMFTT